MQSTLRITEADRDEQGFVKAPTPAEPRSLSDLLPKPAEIRQDATRRQPWTRAELATLAAVALCAMFVLIYAWATPHAPTAVPTPRPTLQPTSAPTAAPVRLLAAFASPDGVTLGTVEETRAMTPTARFGADWVQADVAGSGLVWFRAGQFKLETVSDLPDLAPPTPRPAPAVQPVSVPVASPAPCTQDIAPYVVHRQIQADTLPIGEVTGWSCMSAAEAEASASAQEAQVHASYQATTTTKTSEAGR